MSPPWERWHPAGIIRPCGTQSPARRQCSQGGLRSPPVAILRTTNHEQGT